MLDDGGREAVLLSHHFRPHQMCMPDSKGVGQNFAPVETIGPSGEHTSHTEVEVNNTQVQDLEMTSILYFWRKLTSDRLRVAQS